MNLQVLLQQEFSEAQAVLQAFVADSENFARIEAAAQLMAGAIQADHKIISCGNGGSHCDAMHFAEELSGRYRENRRALPAIAVSDVSHMSCVGNDFGYEFVFSRFVEALGRPGDVLLVLSTSGNSANVLRAVHAARERGMKVVVLSGKDGGKLAGLADVEIRVPHVGYADRIQEIHVKVIHNLILLIEKLVV